MKSSLSSTKMEISSKWPRGLQMRCECSSKLMPSLLTKMELTQSQIWTRRLYQSHGHTTMHLWFLTRVSTTMATQTARWMPHSGAKSPQAPHLLHQWPMKTETIMVVSSTLARSHSWTGIMLMGVVSMVLIIKTRIWCKKRAKRSLLIIHRAQGKCKFRRHLVLLPLIKKQPSRHSNNKKVFPLIYLTIMLSTQS